MDIYINLLLGITIVGIINTMYISWHVIKPSDVACLFFPKEWCLKVQYSKYSRTFGIPNGYLGFGMLMAILILTLAWMQEMLPFWPVALLSTAGFLFSLYFFYIQAKVLQAFCIWCLVSLAVFTGLFIVSMLIEGVF